MNKCRMSNEHSKDDSRNQMNRGMLIVVSSPSGGGKGTLIDRVLKTVPNVSYSVSFTTRAPRPAEEDGREYFFIERATFEKMIERGEFLEWADVYGHLYGTSCKQVERERAAGHDIILEIDVQGAESIREKLTDVVSIFILPPSFELLRERLLARGTDSAEALEKRMRGAPSEVEQYRHFQYVILNDDINRASQQLGSVIYAERARRERQEVNLRSVLEDFGVFQDPVAGRVGH
ncbi:MAG TPA: guanylate kinase [Pyrinomonadaceae bacterium]|nr:guanylate kinase [Pyrinomonadaceae bacterium]